MEADKLDEKVVEEMRRVQDMAPFRIIWAMRDKDTGAVDIFASGNMRQPNVARREGHRVFVLKAPTN